MTSESSEQDAIERELLWVRGQAGAPRPPMLGCSTVSHGRLGFCSGCLRDDDGARLEVAGWRLLALREASDA